MCGCLHMPSCLRSNLILFCGTLCERMRSYVPCHLFSLLLWFPLLVDASGSICSSPYEVMRKSLFSWLDALFSSMKQHNATRKPTILVVFTHADRFRYDVEELESLLVASKREFESKFTFCPECCVYVCVHVCAFYIVSIICWAVTVCVCSCRG